MPTALLVPLHGSIHARNQTRIWRAASLPRYIAVVVIVSAAARTRAPIAVSVAGQASRVRCREGVGRVECGRGAESVAGDGGGHVPGRCLRVGFRVFAAGDGEAQGRECSHRARSTDGGDRFHALCPAPANAESRGVKQGKDMALSYRAPEQHSDAPPHVCPVPPASIWPVSLSIDDRIKHSPTCSAGPSEEEGKWATACGLWNQG